MPEQKPHFFRAAADFRMWLAKHHTTETELVVGIYKKETGRNTITYPEALDEALATGWIDGVRRRLDDESYSIRFSPRKSRSIWSKVNIKRVGELIAAGRMQPAGLAAFERRDVKRMNVYSYEREHAAFSPEELKGLAAEKKAAAFFEGQPPYYRRVATHWVASAKRAETRARRMASLIECSRKGERIGLLALPKPKK